MFFSYALLLFLLGISVNALPMSFETAAQKVKITVSGMDVSNTRWYRLELPTKDPMPHDAEHHDDVIEIKTDNFAKFLIMLDYPGAFNTVMDSDLTNGNLRRIVGVWGALPNSRMSIDDRNRELHCEIGSMEKEKESDGAGQLKCTIQQAKTSGIASPTSDSLPGKEKDAWYRVKAGPGGDINDVFSHDRDGSLHHHVLNPKGTYGHSNIADIQADRFVGTYRLIPNDSIDMTRRRELLIITMTEQGQTRKSLSHPGQTKVAKKYRFFGPVIKQQVLHYALVH